MVELECNFGYGSISDQAWIQLGFQLWFNLVSDQIWSWIQAWINLGFKLGWIQVDQHWIQTGVNFAVDRPVRGALLGGALPIEPRIQ